MSTTAQTKLFGMRIPVDPKVLLGSLAVIIALLFWFNSRSDDVPSSSSSASVHSETLTPPPAPVRVRTPVSRRSAVSSDRGVLRLRPIDPSKGDIDPTLRLELLARLQNVKPASGGRSLFEAGNAGPGTGPGGMTAVPLHPPTILPKPYPMTSANGLASSSGPVPVNIPLKYYGYVKPSQPAPDPKTAGALSNNQGFFLDGDNVLVASEGEVLKQRYLVVALTPTGARMEDTQLRQGQTLPVVAAATP